MHVKLSEHFLAAARDRARPQDMALLTEAMLDGRLVATAVARDDGLPPGHRLVVGFGRLLVVFRLDEHDQAVVTLLTAMREGKELSAEHRLDTHRVTLVDHAMVGVVMSAHASTEALAKARHALETRRQEAG